MTNWAVSSLHFKLDYEITFQTYCKFVGAPITVHDRNNPIGTKDGDLPHFTHGKRVTLNTFDDVVDHLRAEFRPLQKRTFLLKWLHLYFTCQRQIGVHHILLSFERF